MSTVLRATDRSVVDTSNGKQLVVNEADLRKLDGDVDGGVRVTTYADHIEIQPLGDGDDD